MSARSEIAENRWVPRLLATVTMMVATCVFDVVAHVSRSVALPPMIGLDALGVLCLVMTVRTGMAQAGVRLAALAAERAELHTPRAPDAAPDQCPICAGFGLDELAADDTFMERGPDRAKIVAYGTRRAHWDCAEVVPHKAAVGGRVVESDGGMFLPKGFELESRIDPERLFTGPDGNAYVRYAPAPSGSVLCTCRFCGEQQHSPDMATGEARLIAHARACPERGRVEARERAVAARPSWMTEAEARHLADIEEAAAAPCRPTGAANAAWCERQAARIVEETRRRWTS